MQTKRNIRVRRASSLVSIDAGRPAFTPTREASAAFASGSTICRQPFFCSQKKEAMQGDMKHRIKAAHMNENITPERGGRERTIDSQHNRNTRKKGGSKARRQHVHPTIVSCPGCHDHLQAAGDNGSQGKTDVHRDKRRQTADARPAPQEVQRHAGESLGSCDCGQRQRQRRSS